MTTTSPEPMRRVRISALRTEVRARAALDENAVKEYADAMRAQAKFPPVVVFKDHEALWLADGHHRVEAGRRAGRMVIRAEVHTGGRREALLYACGANAAHGVRRTNADKRRAVKLMLNDPEWRQWVNLEIARRCAVDEGLVRRVLASCNIQWSLSKLGRDRLGWRRSRQGVDLLQLLPSQGVGTEPGLECCAPAAHVPPDISPVG
jgi:hypothetical protein